MDCRLYTNFQSVTATIGDKTQIRDRSKACKCSKFLFFPFLPTEIRLMVWGYAIPGPRIIKLNIGVEGEGVVDSEKVGSSSPPEENGLPISFRYFFTSETYLDERVSMLLACCESRLFALQKLPGVIPVSEACREDRFSPKEYTLSINPNQDTIYFPNFMKFCWATENARNGIELSPHLISMVQDIKHILVPAFALRDFNRIFDHENNICGCLDIFPNLESISIRMESGRGGAQYEIVELTIGSDPLRPTRTPDINGHTIALTSARDPLLYCYDDASENVLQMLKRHDIQNGRKIPDIKLVGFKKRRKDKSWILGGTMINCHACEHTCKQNTQLTAKGRAYYPYQGRTLWPGGRRTKCPPYLSEEAALYPDEEEHLRGYRDKKGFYWDRNLRKWIQETDATEDIKEIGEIEKYNPDLFIIQLG